MAERSEVLDQVGGSYGSESVLTPVDEQIGNENSSTKKRKRRRRKRRGVRSEGEHQDKTEAASERPEKTEVKMQQQSNQEGEVEKAGSASGTTPRSDEIRHKKKEKHKSKGERQAKPEKERELSEKAKVENEQRLNQGEVEKPRSPGETTPQSGGGRRRRPKSKRESESSEAIAEKTPGHQTLNKENKSSSAGGKESPFSERRRQSNNKFTPDGFNKHNSPARSTPQGRKQRPYDEYWSKEEVSRGLKRGALLKGTLRINPKNFELAWVTVPDIKRDVMVEGRLMRNRALHGDVVALRLLPRECWKEVQDEQFASPSRPPMENSNSACSISQGVAALSLSPRETGAEAAQFHGQNSPADEHLQKTACVVYIIEKKHTRVSGGRLKPFSKTHKGEGLFTPSDSRLPRLRIPRDSCPPGLFERPQDFENTLFVARITSWNTASPLDNFYAMGAVSRSLGEAGEIEPETEGILLEYGIDSGPFPDEALACLPEEHPWRIPEVELSHRRDFRGDCVFTIDPMTARDLDDALHCKVLDDGNLEIGVHIADVGYFVRPDTPLDHVARDRATSTYMVQKVVPMLPRRLCEELCSLNPGEDRLTFSIVWKMNRKGDVLDEWKGRGVIRSRVKMAYEHAQEMLEDPKRSWQEGELPQLHGKVTAEEISASVNTLQSIARRLHHKRIENGALRLNQVKLKFDLDKTTGCPIGYRASESREANSLIEEFMLLANMATALHIYSAFPDMALLRRHPKPHPKQLEDFLNLCEALSIPFDGGSSGAIHNSLTRFPVSSTERLVLVSLIMKPMKNAEYFCSGSVEESKYGHYALSVPLYTHFTSPIRRYADIAVHRLLAASLKIDEPYLKSSEDVDVIAVNCNDRKLAAKTAGELSAEMFFGIFVRECGPLEEEGVVTAVMDQSLDILVPCLGLTRRVFCKYCPRLKEHEFSRAEKKQPAEMKLIWSLSGDSIDQVVEVEQVLRVFTNVRVKITSESQVEVNSKPFKFYFELLPPTLPETESNAANQKLRAPDGPTTQSEQQSLDAGEVRRQLFQSESEERDDVIVEPDSDGAD